MNTDWCDTLEDAVISWNSRPREEQLQAAINDLSTQLNTFHQQVTELRDELRLTRNMNTRLRERFNDLVDQQE